MLDFGIAGKTAVVCASSKGLGFGCADALAAVGANLVMNARTPETLADAAARIRDAQGVEVKEVPADITTPEGRAAVLEAAGHVDILVNNAGGPPPGDFRDWTRETWITEVVPVRVGCVSAHGDGGARAKRERARRRAHVGGEDGGRGVCDCDGISR